MKRRFLLQCGIAAAAVSLGAAPVLAQPPAPAANKANVGGPGSLDGIWNALGYEPNRPGRPAGHAKPIITVDGKPLPLTPQARALLDEHLKLAAAGKAPARRDPGSCVPPGMPSLMDPIDEAAIQIIETPQQNQISVLSESYQTFRIIHMNAKHPDDPDPTFQGHSIGRWEGATLVVDTIGLQDTTDIFNLGIPHSEEMHVIERIRRVSETRLENLMTIEDPKIFSHPFAVKITLKQIPGMLLRERICEL